MQMHTVNIQLQPASEADVHFRLNLEGIVLKSYDRLFNTINYHPECGSSEPATGANATVSVPDGQATWHSNATASVT